jgi:signal transduction histidine kinase
MIHHKPSATNTHFAHEARSNGEEVGQAHRKLALDGVITMALDAVPVLVLILNQNNQILHANLKTCQTFDRGLPDLLGLRFCELVECENAGSAPCGGGTGEACRTCGALLAVLESQNGQAACRECQILRRGGGGLEALDFRIDCRALALREERHTLFVATDISAEKRRDVLERIFFHDVLDRAAALQGIASLLADDALPLEDAKDDLSISASALIQEIRSHQMLVAAEKGRLELEISQVNSLEFLNGLKRSCWRHPVAAGRHIILAPDAAGFSLVTERAILNRVMGNLLKNALEASLPDSRITLGCQLGHSGPVFTCHNPGCMPADVQLQMFHRSFSTKGKGRGTGTYSVKLLTEKYLQGRVAFTSTPASGTTFEVTLPYALPMAAAAQP